MAYREKTIRDGWANTLGGIDSGRATNLLAKNTLAFAVNVSMRGGYAETRPPFVKPELNNDTPEITTWWQANETQGARYFAPVDKNPLIIVSIGGRIFKIDVLADFRVSEITPTGRTETTGSFISPPQTTSVTVIVTTSDKIQLNLPVIIGDGIYTVTAKNNNILTVTNQTATGGVSIASGTPVIYLDVNPKNRPQAWMEQADKYFLIQDGQSSAAIYDGSTMRRAGPTEVPTGTVMVFNEEIGRLAVGLPTNEVAIGDVIDPISFTETGYLNEGGKFRIPRKFGNITGACMLANQDRSNGQGAMLFFTRLGITAFNLPPNRDTWKALNYPVQINMPIKGTTSHGSITLVNGDAFYRATDGIRSFALTRQEFGQWGNTPLSRELGRVLNSDDRKLTSFASAVLFDNRLLFTVMPQPGRYGAYHGGLGVLDYEGVSAMGERARPRYDGVWSGIKPTHLVTGDFGGEERCFAFTRNADGGVELWEILRKGNFDGDDGRITSWIETRGMDFENQFELKRLDGFEMWIDRVFGTVDFDLKYRPDLFPCWTDWDTKKICQKHTDCDDDPLTGVCRDIKTYRQGYRNRQAFGQPKDTDENELSETPMRVGHMYELKLQWVGRARIKWGLAKAIALPEDANPAIESEET